MIRTALLLALATLLLPAADWPINGGPNNTRYTALSQITPANVSHLEAAWTYDAHDAFKNSEMQSNPIVIDGILYATTPKLRVIALDARTGRELWSFDPSAGDTLQRRFRHRGVTVYQDRLFVSYRGSLFCLNRLHRANRLVPGFGDEGKIDLRKDLDRPFQSLSVSASSPGVVYEISPADAVLIMGSAVPETLPGAPGDIRAYDVRTGALRWTFHTIPHPGEFGYDTWPADAWKIAGGANAWAGLSIDPKLGIVFAATGSAAFDFYGSNRIGDNLFANTILALDARTGKRLWHFQGVKHDLWDLDFPAAPSLVTVTRNGRKVDAVAQITKTGFVFVLDRRTGKPLFPVEYRPVPASTLDGERAAVTQAYPVKPPPFTRQAFTEAMVTTRTPEAHAFVLDWLRKLDHGGMFTPPSTRGTVLMPGTDGGGEWGGAAFDPDTALLYVNANEQPWIIRMVTQDTTSLYQNNCASCHKADRTGTPPTFPFVDRYRPAPHPPGVDPHHLRRHRPHARVLAFARRRDRRLPPHRQRHVRGTFGRFDRSHRAEISQRRLHPDARSGRLSAAHPTLGHAQRHRSQQRRNPLAHPLRRISGASRQGSRSTQAAITTAAPS